MACDNEKVIIEHKRGTDAVYDITVTDDNGNPVDITGATIFFTVKYKSDTDETDSQALIAKTVTTHIDPVNGVTSFTISKTDSNIFYGSYRFDMQYKNAIGSKSGSNVGIFNIVDVITNRDS